MWKPGCHKLKDLSGKTGVCLDQKHTKGGGGKLCQHFPGEEQPDGSTGKALIQTVEDETAGKQDGMLCNQFQVLAVVCSQIIIHQKHGNDQTGDGAKQKHQKNPFFSCRIFFMF